MDRLGDPQRPGQPAKRSRVSAAADQQVDRPGTSAVPGPKCPQQWPQTLECEVVAHEQADQVGGFEAQQVAERAPRRAGVTDLDPLGIDRVGYDVNPLARNVVEL